MVVDRAFQQAFASRRDLLICFRLEFCLVFGVILKANILFRVAHSSGYGASGRFRRVQWAGTSFRAYQWLDGSTAGNRPPSQRKFEKGINITPHV
jgi:hypothetical protein